MATGASVVSRPEIVSADAMMPRIVHLAALLLVGAAALALPVDEKNPSILDSMDPAEVAAVLASGVTPVVDYVKPASGDAMAAMAEHNHEQKPEEHNHGDQKDDALKPAVEEAEPSKLAAILMPAEARNRRSPTYYKKYGGYGGGGYGGGGGGCCGPCGQCGGGGGGYRPPYGGGGYGGGGSQSYSQSSSQSSSSSSSQGGGYGKK